MGASVHDWSDIRALGSWETTKREKELAGLSGVTSGTLLPALGTAPHLKDKNKPESEGPSLRPTEAQKRNVVGKGVDEAPGSETGDPDLTVTPQMTLGDIGHIPSLSLHLSI